MPRVADEIFTAEERARHYFMLHRAWAISILEVVYYFTSAAYFAYSLSSHTHATAERAF